MTGLALRSGRAVAFKQARMPIHPILSDGMHSVRAAIDSAWHCRVACGALDHDTRVALDLDVSDVIVQMRARKLGVRGSVAGFALQSAVAG